MMVDLVSPVEIADRLGVPVGTVHQWRHRGVLPEPEWVLSRIPIWRWATIRQWADDTGRTP